MRNIKRINRLADFIEEQTELPFDMVSHRTCCMGFLGVMIGGYEPGDVTATVAAELLNITRQQAKDLFIHTPWAGPTLLENITREQAVVMLRRFAETGQYLGGGSR